METTSDRLRRDDDVVDDDAIDETGIGVSVLLLVVVGGAAGTSASPSMARIDSAVFVGNDGRELIRCQQKNKTKC